MKTFTTKTGKHITLRPPQQSDVDVLLDFINTLVDEDAYILINKKQTRHQEIKYVQETLKQIQSGLKVQLHAYHGQTLTGNCQITKGLYRDSHVGTFGIALAKKYRADGIGTTLATHVIDQARQKLHVSLIQLEVFSENTPAQALYKKLGFKQFGTLPQGINYQNSFIDRIYMYKEV